MIYLVRHALARYDTGVPYGIAPGPPLAEAGIAQAEAAADLLEGTGIARVVSSPLRRCRMTAEPICAKLGLDLQIDDDLGEMQGAEQPSDVAMRMLRAVLANVDVPVVALVSHAAPIEQLFLALTHGRIVLPAPGDRGARIGTGEVWQALRYNGEWHVHQLRLGGVRM